MSKHRQIEFVNRQCSEYYKLLIKMMANNSAGKKTAIKSVQAIPEQSQKHSIRRSDFFSNLFSSTNMY